MTNDNPLKEIMLDGVKYTRSDLLPQVAPVAVTPIGQYCIIRCRDAGVWAGIIESVNGRAATVLDARRLWYWNAKQGHTLSAVANYGIKSDSKLPAAVPVVYLTETCELIPCTETAKTTIIKQKEHSE